jgi:hypothetical protein
VGEIKLDAIARRQRNGLAVERLPHQLDHLLMPRRIQRESLAHFQRGGGVIQTK